MSSGVPGVRSAFRWAGSAYGPQALPILALLLGWAAVWAVLEVLVIGSRTAPGRPAWVLLHLGYFWGTAYWEAAILRHALDAHDGKRRALTRVFRQHRMVMHLLVLKLSMIPLTLAGCALVVVPGLVVVARLGPAFFRVVDRGSGPLEALSWSWEATRGHTPTLTLLALALFLFNCAGAAILGLGLIVTLPMTALAGAYTFRTVSPALTPPQTAG